MSDVTYLVRAEYFNYSTNAVEEKTVEVPYLDEAYVIKAIIGYPHILQKHDGKWRTWHFEKLADPQTGRRRRVTQDVDIPIALRRIDVSDGRGRANTTTFVDFAGSPELMEVRINLSTEYSVLAPRKKYSSASGDDDRSGFVGCRSLYKVELLGNIGSIAVTEGGAFSECPNLRAVLVYQLPKLFKRSIDRARSEAGKRVDERPTLISMGVPQQYYCGMADPYVSSVSYELNAFGIKPIPLTDTEVEALGKDRSVDSSCAEVVSDIKEKSPAIGSLGDGAAHPDDAVWLRDYLKAVCGTESNVLQLSKSLVLAMSVGKRVKNARDNRKAYVLAVSNARARVSKDMESKALATERRLIQTGSKLDSKARSMIGPEPVDPSGSPAPQKPEAPKLGTPRWFNRAKVTAANAELEKAYAEAMEVYERAVSQRRDQLERYRIEHAEWEARRQKAIDAQLASLDSRSSSIPMVKRDEDRITVQLEALSDAIGQLSDETQAQLVKAVGLLKAAYSADVVFPKYRNLAAMTTMLEYLETGRCTSLQGPDGAYNLYESERRQDLIIDRLDTITDKLDQIQQNQYMLFTAIEESNRSLQSISNTLDEVLDVAISTQGTLEQISEKATAVASNSARTAYWSRKNAELIDSLGYLVALS